MSHTNSTTNYNLPQFITTDKPAWLTDVNNAYSAIDLGMHAAKSAADSAQSDATQALSDAAGAGSTANTANSKAGGAIASIAEDFLDSATYDVGELVMYNNLLYKCSTAVSVPGAWTGSVNWSRATIDGLLPKNGDFSLAGLSDTTISAPSNGQRLGYNGSKWVNTGANTSCTCTKGSTMPNDMPTGSLYRRDNTMVFVNGSQLPAGSYSASDVLWNVTPAPIATFRGLFMLGSNVVIVTCNNSGEVRFNNSQTLNSSTYLIGELPMLVD